MLVEDEISTLNLLKIIVDWEIFHMKIAGTASNGREALFQIPEVKPDLIITDIKMPIMDGIELAEEIKKLYPQIKVMIVTAYEDIKLAQRALRSGVIDFILKPLKRQEIKDALTRVEELFIKSELQKEQETQDLMERVKVFLEENYFRKELSLPLIAEQFYINSSYLSRAFSKRYGITLVECLNQIRVEHACHYLEEGNWKIYQVAERVGIPNPDYFSKCFKKVMGISVKEYKSGKNSTENGQNN
jgi:YesN/AraC family two-component response regulator